MVHSSGSQLLRRSKARTMSRTEHVTLFKLILNNIEPVETESLEALQNNKTELRLDVVQSNLSCSFQAHDSRR